MQSNLNDASGAVELPTQLDTELLDAPPLTPAAQQDGDIFRDPLFSCFASQMEYIAMGEALEADLAGILPAKNRWYKKLRFLLSLRDTRNTSLYTTIE